MLTTLLDWFDTHAELGAASPELVDVDGRRAHAGEAVSLNWGGPWQR
jgi:hypothetical protein